VLRRVCCVRVYVRVCRGAETNVSKKKEKGVRGKKRKNKKRRVGRRREGRVSFFLFYVVGGMRVLSCVGCMCVDQQQRTTMCVCMLCGQIGVYVDCMSVCVFRFGAGWSNELRERGEGEIASSSSRFKKGRRCGLAPVQMLEMKVRSIFGGNAFQQPLTYPFDLGLWPLALSSSFPFNLVRRGNIASLLCCP
jgi:hypothetical protein